jgi:hypothetical protein
MNISYNIFFTLQVTIGGTATSAFSFCPDSDTQTTLGQHDLLFKPTNGCFLVAAANILNPQQVAIVPYPLQGITKFSFLMALGNVPAFLGQADLQLTGQDTSRVGRSIYYFNNLDATGKPDGAASGNALNLSQQSLVSVADLWSVIPASYSFYVDPTKYTQVQLFELLPEASPVQLSNVFAAGASSASFSLNGYNPGPFQLKWIGTPARQENVYADPTLAATQFFALVEIYKDSSANSVLLNGPPITYTIPFKSL